MKTYDREAFWALCKAEAPWLTRADFDSRWNTFWRAYQWFGASGG